MGGGKRRSRSGARKDRAKRSPRKRATGVSRTPPIVASARSKTSGSGPTIVGIGASAGGLEAFSQLLQALPDDSDLALVLVQHLAPQHESVLPELLGGKTRLPVHQVKNGMHVEPGHVYVIPPNVQMGITDGVLHLVPRPGDRTQYTPIDFFLRSLAQTSDNRAIGVILSGTASDGSLGVREIKAVGGITIAQAPETAKYDGMPRAAIATGMVDLVLSPREIAAELVKIGRHPYVKHAWPRKEGDELPLDDETLQRIFSLLRASSGVDFRHYKMPTIRRRLQRRMALHKFSGFSQYVKYLQEHPAEVDHLYQDILIHVTRFFREPESFEVLTNHVFPAIVERRIENEPIRAWIPGCSTGEEAYSIAITLTEFLERKDKGGIPIQIFGTDISEAAVEYARTGQYPESISADVSAERLQRFFTKTDGNYRINKALRDLCIFARQDVTRDPPFSRLDLILCRNVLIYMSAGLQQRLMGIFHYALRPTGFLLLGHAETIGPSVELFEVGERKNRIYKKRAAIAPRAPIDYVSTGHSQKNVPVRKDGIRVKTNGDWRVVNLEILPLSGPAKNHLLILFEDVAEKEPPRIAVVAGRKGKRARPLQVRARRDERQVSELQQELAASREYLQSIIQELEAANEELQSANEEVLSSNEELQSTNEELDTAKEELQSTNEELNTVNEELHGRNEELSGLNSDLVNLLASVQIAIVIVGSDRRIRRFTPMAEKVLNLIGGDVGRPIGHIKPNIDCPDLEQLITQVVDSMAVYQRDVRDAQGRWFSLRIRPYKNVDNKIDGAVVSLFDIDRMKRNERALEEARDFARSIVETVRQPLLLLDGELRVRMVNRAFCEAFNVNVGTAENRSMYELGDGQWNIPKVREFLEEVLPKNNGAADVEVMHDFASVGPRKLHLNARYVDPKLGDGGALILLAMEDITARKGDGGTA